MGKIKRGAKKFKQPKDLHHNSKIFKLGLHDDIIYLKRLGMGYQQICDEINNSGRLTEEEFISPATVSNYLKKVPELTKEITKKDDTALMQVVSANLDIVGEVTDLYKRTKTMMENLERDAADKNKNISPYHYKAVSSEMREMLEMMIDIQKEISDYDNVRKFMEIVMRTVKEEAPETIPKIVERLKETKNTSWFSNMFGKVDDNE